MIMWYSFFFFKQKTAYEMRISDWSSDVCSSDLEVQAAPLPFDRREGGIDRGVVGDVAGQHDLGADRLGQRAHPLLQGLPLKREGELRSLFASRRGAAQGNGPVVGATHDKDTLTGHTRLGHGHSLSLSEKRSEGRGGGSWFALRV